jgi:hypothetical protein
MKTELLIESLAADVCKIISESTNDGKDLWLNGCFMQAEIKNRNNRIYPLAEMTAAVTSFQQMIAENNGILGELEHPERINILSHEASHLITSLTLEGNNVYGKAKILPTPKGQIAKALIESGVRMGVSSRGTGNVNESGSVSNFNIATVDIVTTPSAQGAYPKSVYESLEMAKNGTQILSLAEQIQHDAAAQQYLVKEVLKWVNTGVFARK